MRSQGLLLLLLRVSATVWIHSAQDSSTGLQLAAAMPVRTSSIRRVSVADELSSDTHRRDEASSNSTSTSTLSDDSTSSSDDDDDATSSTPNATTAMKSAVLKATKKRVVPTIKGFNNTEPLEVIPKKWQSDNVPFKKPNVKETPYEMLPEEQAPPAFWPVIVFGIFVLLAAGLCSATAIKSCKGKRKNYDEIESLIV